MKTKNRRRAEKNTPTKSIQIENTKTEIIPQYLNL